MAAEHYLTFGPFRFETTQARLWREEHAVPLRPRTGTVLQYLATHPGRLVTKTELLQHIWAGRHVTETVLRVCIREIRVALSDAAEAPQYLQTVGRHGYQWLVAGTARLSRWRRHGPSWGARPKSRPWRGGLHRPPRVTPSSSSSVGKEGLVRRRYWTCG